MPSPRNAGPPRGPSVTPYLLIALAIAVVIHATMGAPRHEAGKDARQAARGVPVIERIE
jgi:hypothetical protein